MNIPITPVYYRMYTGTTMIHCMLVVWDVPCTYVVTRVCIYTLLITFSSPYIYISAAEYQYANTNDGDRTSFTT